MHNVHYPIYYHRAAVLVLAMTIDLVLGDPPNRYHPVAWMGRWLHGLRQFSPTTGRVWPFAYGAFAVVGSMVGWALLGKILLQVMQRMPWPVVVVGEALLLKTTFALRGLCRAAEAVHDPLVRDDLPTARQQLRWHLVSRETTALSCTQVAAATIESVAENASDGLLAPLFYYGIGGLPAAVGYRFLNTADAMWGYRDEAREWLGKPAARLDDLANLIPARLTALAFLLAAPFCGGRLQQGWHCWRRDAGATTSPNAGHPMSAMAGVLGVELEKVDQYRLGAGGRAPLAADIRRSVRTVQRAMIGACGVMVALLWWRSCGGGARRLRIDK